MAWFATPTGERYAVMAPKCRGKTITRGAKTVKSSRTPRSTHQPAIVSRRRPGQDAGPAVVGDNLERPLYAFIGFFALFSDVRFAWRLMTDEVEQIMYGFGKGGHAHDFVRIAESVNISLTTVAAVFLACCLLPVATAFWFHWWLNVSAEESVDVTEDKS